MVHDSIREALEDYKETVIQKGDEIVEYIKQDEIATDGVVAILDNLHKEKISERQNSANK